METIGVIMETVVEKFKGLWQSKKVIEGFLLYSDKETNTTLLLVEEGPKMWKTRWFNDSQYSYKAPNKNINSIFTN